MKNKFASLCIAIVFFPIYILFPFFLSVTTMIWRCLRWVEGFVESQTMLNLYRPSFYLQLLFRVSQTDPKQNNFFLLVLACLLQFLFLTWSSTSQSKGKVHLGFGEGKKTPLLSIIKYILTVCSALLFSFIFPHLKN